MLLIKTLIHICLYLVWLHVLKQKEEEDSMSLLGPAPRVRSWIQHSGTYLVAMKNESDWNWTNDDDWGMFTGSWTPLCLIAHMSCCCYPSYLHSCLVLPLKILRVKSKMFTKIVILTRGLNLFTAESSWSEANSWELKGASGLDTHVHGYRYWFRNENHNI